jgi:hypothetical protein
MEGKGILSRRAVVAASILILIVVAAAAIAAVLVYSLKDPTNGCNPGDSQVPSSIQGIVSKIEQNSTFISLENGRLYAFESYSQQQTHYDNGTVSYGNTIVEFACGSNPCIPPINAVVTVNGRIIQIYAQSGNGVQFGMGHESSSC